MPADVEVAKAPKLITQAADYMARDFVFLLTGKAGGLGKARGFVCGGNPEALAQSPASGQGPVITGNSASWPVARSRESRSLSLTANKLVVQGTGGQGQSRATSLHGLRHGILVEHPQPILVACVSHWLVGVDASHGLATCPFALPEDFGPHPVVLVERAHGAAE